MFTIKNLDELAGYFTAKAREMNEMAQRRTGLSKHNYAGQAHAYNDCAITIRNCKLEGSKRGKKRNSTGPGVRSNVSPAGSEKALLDDN